MEAVQRGEETRGADEVRDCRLPHTLGVFDFFCNRIAVAVARSEDVRCFLFLATSLAFRMNVCDRTLEVRAIQIVVEPI